MIREVTDSKLVGRGGAAFPTGRKWEAVARAPVRPHYLVCNADESEPGTFKDRVLMEEDPFALVEAMTIAGFATGCELGYLYIRGEYPLATARLALGDRSGARRAGSWATTSSARACRFDIELAPRRRRLHLRRGDGALQLDRGLRGEPRNKPPFPVQSGLFGKPTVVNNVETLVNVLDVVLEGGPAFAALGTGGSTGTKLFCLCGAIAHPGVYEVPFGTTLREMIELAGGVRGGRALRAVLLGGAAGAFVTPDELDMPLTFEGTRAAGATLGSGVVMVFDDTADLSDVILRIGRFFRDESCGQCVPCRVGTIRQEEALHRIVFGASMGSPADARTSRIIDELGQVMRDASICGLGQTASSAVQSAIRKKLFGERRHDEPRRPTRPASSRCRQVELTIDGRAVTRAGGHDDPAGVPGAGDRHADALLSGNAHAGQRLPRLRRRGRGLARAGAGVLAAGRAEDGGAHRHRARAPQPPAGARAARLVGRSRR